MMSPQTLMSSPVVLWAQFDRWHGLQRAGSAGPDHPAELLRVSGTACTRSVLTASFIVIVANSWVSDRRGRRPEHILFGLAIVATGFIILATVKKSVGGRYVGILLMGTTSLYIYSEANCVACTNSAVAPLLAFRTTTVSGATATAVASAGIAAFANISGPSQGVQLQPADEQASPLRSYTAPGRLRSTFLPL